MNINENIKHLREIADIFDMLNSWKEINWYGVIIEHHCKCVCLSVYQGLLQCANSRIKLYIIYGTCYVSMAADSRHRNTPKLIKPLYFKNAL